MNIKALKRTRDLIASAKGETYDQRKLRHECGTPACIAGFAIAANPELVKSLEEMGYSYLYLEMAERILGLNYFEAAAMFAAIPHGFAQSYSQLHGERPTRKTPPTRAEALDMLDRAIETGRIEWRASP